MATPDQIKLALFDRAVATCPDAVERCVHLLVHRYVYGTDQADVRTTVRDLFEAVEGRAPSSANELRKWVFARVQNDDLMEPDEPVTTEDARGACEE